MFHGSNSYNGHQLCQILYLFRTSLQQFNRLMTTIVIILALQYVALLSLLLYIYMPVEMKGIYVIITVFTQGAVR
jgi:hypothetical protein